MKVPKVDLKNVKASDMVEGVSAHWFLKHLPVILLLVFFAMAYISVRFDCITAMETVSALKTRLEITRTETQRERSLYMSATCESSMKQLVDTLGLGLSIQERPPYILKMPE